MHCTKTDALSSTNLTNALFPLLLLLLLLVQEVLLSLVVVVVVLPALAIAAASSDLFCKQLLCFRSAEVAASTEVAGFAFLYE